MGVSPRFSKLLECHGVRKWIFDAAAVDLTTEFAKKKEKVVRLPLVSVVVPVMNTYKYPGFWCFFRRMVSSDLRHV